MRALVAVEAGDGSQGSVNLRNTPVMNSVMSAVGIGSGLRHMCAIVGPARTITCWGYNDARQASLTDGSTVIASPAALSSVSQVDALGLGDRHTCYLGGSKIPTCFGQNSQGQLGNGNVNPATGLVTVSNLTAVTAIAAAENHTCALEMDGTVWCWGRVGNMTAQAAPVKVVLSGLATKIAVGELHACAVLQNGTVECWGANDVGQHGDGVPGPDQTPTFAQICP